MQPRGTGYSPLMTFMSGEQPVAAGIPARWMPGEWTGFDPASNSVGDDQPATSPPPRVELSLGLL